MSATRSTRLADLEARRDQLREQYESTSRRARQLADVRARAESRRQEIREQRSRLDVDITSRRAALHSADAVAAAAILDSAVKVTGIDPEQLWIDYVALGGDASPDRLRAMLAGEAPLVRLDHDRLVLALNERLADAGHQRLLSFWDGSR